jgi:predicted Zn-dependent peptidase
MKEIQGMKRTLRMLNRASTTALTLALCASVLLAQEPQTLKGVILKGKAPVSKEVLKVSLPKAFETTLPDGMRVIVLENHKLPTFAMQMFVLSGGLSDPANQPGIAQYAAAMLREGTKTRTSKQISEAVESLGSTLSASSGLSSQLSTVSAGGLTENFDQIMELFADVIQNPSYPADELNTLKGRALAQLRFQRSQPDFLANEMFSKVMYGDHPAGRVSQKPEQIQSLTPEILRQFHSTYYKPNNAIFAIVGDVKPAEVVAKLEKSFAGWQRGDTPPLNLPKVSDPSRSKIYLIDRPGAEQTNLIIGNLAIERNDPDYYAMDVMNQVLGGGASARLFLNLREDKGYTYGAYSGFSASKYRGVFRSSADVQTDVTKASIDEMINEYKRIRDEKIPADEFDRAKRTIIGSFALQLESPLSLLSNIVTQKVYSLPADYWDTYPQKIASVTAEDVQRVAQKYLDLGKLQIIAVGDAKRIAEGLKKFGDVALYDTEGKPLQSPASTGGDAAASGGASAGAAIPSLLGAWNLTASSPDGQMALRLEIKPKGADMEGTLDTPFGKFPVTGASLQGADVLIKVRAEMQGARADVQLDGKLDGDSMKGQMKSAGWPTVDFTAKREK